MRGLIGDGDFLKKGCLIKTLAETLGNSFYLLSGITVTHNSPVLQTVFISFLSYTVTLHPDFRYDQEPRGMFSIGGA